MLSASAFAFALSAVASASARRAWGALTGASSIALLVVRLGPLCGAIVALLLATTAASILVLVLPYRRDRSRPLALAAALAGAALASVGALTGAFGF